MQVCNFTPFVFTWLLGDVSAGALLMSLMFCPHLTTGVLKDAKEEENGEDESEEEEESEDESLVYLVTVLNACLFNSNSMPAAMVCGEVLVLTSTQSS